MTNRANRGLMDASSRIIAELMRKTSFKDDLRSLLTSIDPDNAPKIIRAVMQSDIEVPLAIVSALPALANCSLKMLEELITLLTESIPTPILKGFLSSLLDDVDAQTFARVVQGINRLVQDLSPALEDMQKRIAQEQSALREG